MRYRIVKEENLLTGRIVYYIEQKRTSWFGLSEWSRDIRGIEGIQGPSVCSLTLSGIKHKLNEIRWGGNMIKTEIIQTDDKK
tara:strand:- start:1800 stop:2045 length:246 start_codon:yes stop_codon:yes gene_type:complete